jgi:hypothetical protein
LFELVDQRNANRIDVVLLRVGCYHLEIAGDAEGEKCVARATSGVNAANRWAHAGVLFHESDSLIEIAAAEEEMIEHSWSIIVRKKRMRHDGDGARNDKELSPRNHPHAPAEWN